MQVHSTSKERASKQHGMSPKNFNSIAWLQRSTYITWHERKENMKVTWHESIKERVTSHSCIRHIYALALVKNFYLKGTIT